MYDHEKGLFDWQKNDIKKFLAYGYTLRNDVSFPSCLYKIVTTEEGIIRHCLRHLSTAEYDYALSLGQ